MIKVRDIYNFIDKIAPFSTQCDWDNSGFLVGDIEKEVKAVGFCLDVTNETLEEAIKENLDLIVSHHPIIFHPQKNFLCGNPAFVSAANNIAIISAHNSFDKAKGGVNDVLCDLLGIKNPVGIETADTSVPLLRIGDVKESEPIDFAKAVSHKLDTTSRVVLGKRKIKKVAVCGGAGADYIADAVLNGADCFVTGDISHHEMLEAENSGITVIASGHFETEYPSTKRMESYIKAEFPKLKTIFLKQTNPVIFVK